jgi:chromosome segregation ATPase
MPDSPESRIAVLTQRVADLDARVRELIAMREAQIRLEGKVDNAADDIREIRRAMHERDEAVGERDKQVASERQQQLQDSKKWRQAMVLGAFSVLAAVITAVATIIAST